MEIDKILIHEEIILDMHKMYIEKNHDYGDSFAKVRTIYPHAIMIRLLDKVNRLQVLLSGAEALVDESIDDTLLDLADYAILELVERKVDKQYLEMYKAHAICELPKSEGDCIDFPIKLDYED